jgi:enoyl-CoA hydratase/carnithine racemase
MSHLEVTHVESVAVLTLKRPDARNRITQLMAEQLVGALAAARSDASVKGCVLTGHGDYFCLGGDYQGAGALNADRMEFGRAHIDMFDAMARLGKPLVAAVNGDAHAGGFALVLACDLAIIAEDATLGLPEAANGLFPFLALAIARDALPKKLLFEIIYNARLLSADEARGVHLVNRAVPRAAVLSTAIAAVNQAARGSPQVLSLGRDLYHSMRGETPEQALNQARFALTSALGAAEEWKKTIAPRGDDERR